MVSGRLIIVVMFVLGAGLFGVQELTRRLATPRSATLAEDRTGPDGSFDRVYRFGEDRYHVKEGAPGEAGADTLFVSRIAPDGTEGPSVVVPRQGPIEEVHILELGKDQPPTLVTVIRTDEERRMAEGIRFRLADGEWSHQALEPIPEELRPRYSGHDRYERQGAFLYRKLDLASLDGESPPHEVKFFYDFENERWVRSE